MNLDSEIDEIGSYGKRKCSNIWANGTRTIGTDAIMDKLSTEGFDISRSDIKIEEIVLKRYSIMMTVLLEKVLIDI